MEFTFDLDQDDFRDFARHAWGQVDKVAKIRARLSVLGWAYYILLAFAFVSACYFISENHGRPLGHFYAAFSFLIASGVCAYLYARRQFALRLKYSTAPGGFFRQQRHVVFNETGVMIDRGNSSQSYQWVAIKAVKKTERLFCLHLDTTQALCIPRRLFASPQASDEFLAFINAHLSRVGSRQC